MRGTLVLEFFVLALIEVAEAIEEGLECRAILRRDLEAGEDAAEVGAVIAVVEEADVPAAAELFEESHERPGPFGKLEAADELVA